VLVGCVGELLCEGRTRSVKGRFDGPGRKSKFVRDGVDAQPQEVVEHHDFALLSRQTIERSAHVEHSRRIDGEFGLFPRCDQLPPGAALRSESPQATTSDVAGHDPDPGFENFDVTTPSEPLGSASTCLVDGLRRKILISGHEGKARDQFPVREEVEVIEPVVEHAPQLWHGAKTREAAPRLQQSREIASADRQFWSAVLAVVG
jgi:hypothetical protein